MGLFGGRGGSLVEGCSEREITPVARICLEVHLVREYGAHNVGWMPLSLQRVLDCLDDCRP